MKQMKNKINKSLKENYDNFSTDSRVENSLVIMDGYRPGITGENFPLVIQGMRGYMLKRRYKPLTGWHKRFVVVENGILEYMRHENQGNKYNKVRGKFNLAQCFISYDALNWIISIDNGSRLHTLKSYTESLFNQWIEVIRDQRIKHQKLALNAGEEIQRSPPSQLTVDQRIFLHTLYSELGNVINNLENAQEKDNHKVPECLNSATQKLSQLRAGLRWINYDMKSDDKSSHISEYFDVFEVSDTERSSSVSDNCSGGYVGKTPTHIRMNNRKADIAAPTD
ncbi:hypothetical protein GJ496_006110 [Pomphorhynchus laevis]|nr:hypothetical protein GJ496_006110 [Pomphorhynchus laevis]